MKKRGEIHQEGGVEGEEEAAPCLLLEVHLGGLARGGGVRVDVHRRRGGLAAKP